MMKPTRLFVLILMGGIAAASANPPAEVSAKAVATLNRPAHFIVRTDVIAENPGAYTFTSDQGTPNAWLQCGNFEPFSRRTKLHATGTAANEIIVPNSTLSSHDSFQSGWFEGATARIYRIANGELVKIREDIVKEHLVEGWSHDSATTRRDQWITGTSIQTYIDPWSRHDCDYYYSLVAISTNGTQSLPATGIAVHIPSSNGKHDALSNETTSFHRPDPSSTEERPDAPTQFTAQYDPTSGLTTCTWAESEDPNIVGYQLVRSDTNPETHRGFHLYLEKSPEDPALHVQTDDIVFLDHEVFSFNRDSEIANRVYSAGQYAIDSPYFNSTVDASWELVPHPGELPEELAIHGGRTCVQLESTGLKPIELRKYNFSSLEQNWYGVLDPTKTYIVEYWARAETEVPARITFLLTGELGNEVQKMPFELTDQWQKFQGEFSIHTLLTKGLGTGQMGLDIRGKGSIWIDNWRVYEKGIPWMGWSEEDQYELRHSKMAAYRSHAHIKTRNGYSMEGFTGTAGNIEWRSFKPNRFNTLPNQLAIIKSAEINPWLQIEMCMSEEEWLGFVEYFCAPYDPQTDTPESKPWAYKRHRQGHSEPYLSDFNRVLFELSNETWNRLFSPFVFNGLQMTDGATDRVYNGGEIYGLLQEYVIAILRSSPYWTEEAEQKFEFVLGGWAVQTSPNGYGVSAGRMSPHSQHMTIGAYNGGWDEGESPVQPEPKGYFKALTVARRTHIPRADQFNLLREKENSTYAMGTYEAGPGYNMNGLNGARMTSEMIEQESQTMKSLAAGTATLDVFLAQSQRGYQLQNFFTFSRNRRYWSSHARMTNGGQAYPSWKALSLYNREGLGDFLMTQTQTVPSWNFTAEKGSRRLPIQNAPLVSVYATRDGDRLNLFVLSLKTEEYPVVGDQGMTPIRIDLPIQSAKKLTLYRMTGKPSDHNLDSDLIKIEQVKLDAALAETQFEMTPATGAKTNGLPPASTYLYVFEGVSWGDPLAEAVIDLAPGQVATVGEAPVRFLIILPPLGTIDPEELTLSGTAGATQIDSCISTPMYGEGTYEVTISEVPQEGTITCNYQGHSATVTFAIPLNESIALASWTFPSTPAENGVVSDEDLQATANSSVILRPQLVHGEAYKRTTNRYYNDQGLGLISQQATRGKDTASKYIGWTIQPSERRVLALDHIMIGLWSMMKEAPVGIRFEYSTDGFKTAHELTLKTEIPVMKCGLAQGSGIPAIVDLTQEKALQKISGPIEFRLHLFGTRPQGIGKLGTRNEDAPDLVIKGRLLK